MIPVCLVCGDKGKVKRLICCKICQDSAVHCYCLDKRPANDDNFDWCCWDCTPEDIQAVRKSERISSKRQKIFKSKCHFEERLHHNKKLIQTSRETNETDQFSIISNISSIDMEPQLIKVIQIDKALVEEIKTNHVVPTDNVEEYGSTIDEQTLSKSTIPTQESFDAHVKVKEVAKERRRLVLDYYSDSQEEDKSVDLQISLLAPHDVKSLSLCKPPSLELSDCICAEPVIDPIWRGLFKIANSEGETSCEIFGHLSSKANSKVTNAAISFPQLLEIQVVDSSSVWPQRFKVSPPTAASIAIYFFPACEWDERVFDGLLYDIIEKDLALKANIDGAELLIFSSRELPVENWRYCSKYYLWGVFRQKHASKVGSINMEANSKSMHLLKSAANLSYPIQLHQIPLSINGIETSNMLTAKPNTTWDRLSSHCIGPLDNKAIS